MRGGLGRGAFVWRTGVWLGQHAVMEVRTYLARRGSSKDGIRDRSCGIEML